MSEWPPVLRHPPSRPRRYRMTLAYDGTKFHGWQEQASGGPGHPPLRTVQGVVRRAIQQRVGRPVHVQGASRTDAGVHALGQVAHFDAETRIPVERLAAAINSRLPADVEVLDARPAPDDFDATREAIDKQYRYRIWTAARRPLHLRHVVYHLRRGRGGLDTEAMAAAAARLVGEHDFAAFATAGHGRLSTVRTIHECRVETHDPSPGDARATPIDGPQTHVVVSGSGFLYNMVRIIVGTLVEIGRGRWEPGHVDHLLAEPRRDRAGPTLPPHGLCLEWIQYPPERG